MERSKTLVNIIYYQRILECDRACVTSPTKLGDRTIVKSSKFSLGMLVSLAHRD
ncbi:hypothetical protein [Nostoc sp. PCC 7107]|uniref:hypothetical protein n=1 Tax=Nostoc sp. PCC 7107 TaxID=317936 RepID=UPI0002F38C3A|nr:hypothetical protein [Nostoc sp. PCC 7107]